MKNSHSSISVSGSGALLAPFVTEGMKHFSEATWYDKSDKATIAYERELCLARWDFLRRSDLNFIDRMSRNLASGRVPDVMIDFDSSAHICKVTIRAWRTTNLRQRKTKTVSVDVSVMTERKLEKVLKKIFRKVERVL